LPTFGRPTIATRGKRFLTDSEEEKDIGTSVADRAR
jgi:hypothetical protein